MEEVAIVYHLIMVSAVLHQFMMINRIVLEADVQTKMALD